MKQITKTDVLMTLTKGLVHRCDRQTEHQSHRKPTKNANTRNIYTDLSSMSTLYLYPAEPARSWRPSKIKPLLLERPARRTLRISSHIDR